MRMSRTEMFEIIRFSQDFARPDCMIVESPSDVSMCTAHLAHVLSNLSLTTHWVAAGGGDGRRWCHS